MLRPVKTYIGKKKSLAQLLLRAQRFNEAKAAYTELCRVAPDDPDNWFLLGAVFGQMGQMQEAIVSCKRAISLRPRAISLRPDHVGAYYNLAQAYMHLRNIGEAQDCFRRVTELNPQHVEAWVNLGNLLQVSGMLHEAESCFRCALRISPENADVYFNLGNVLNSMGLSGAAEEKYKKALQFSPENVEVLHNLGVALYEQSRHDKAIAKFREALQFRPDYSRSYDAILLCMNYMPGVDPKLIYKEHLRWAELFGIEDKTIKPCRISRAARRRLRVGYISPDLREHSVARFLLPLLNNHNKNIFEVYCYANVIWPDEVTKEISRSSDKWRYVASYSSSDLAEVIRNDDVDILVDLAGHTAGNSLDVFRYRPAKIQVTWLGYPNTTGMQAMDYRISDDWADPPGLADTYCTEKIWRLPQGFLCFQPPSQMPHSSNHGDSVVTFASFNAISKLNDSVIALWSEILRLVPRSRLVIKSKVLNDPIVRKMFEKRFDSHGIRKERLFFYGWATNYREHLSRYEEIDIGLDPFPYNGTTTTCEALWMGVPVVTLAGNTHAGRVGVSILMQLEMKELVASNAEAYVRCAVNLANDKDWRTGICKKLNKKMCESSLCDGSSFAAKMEEAYLEMWRIGCSPG